MEQKEVKLVTGDATVPADMLMYVDPERGQRCFVRKGSEYQEVTKDPKEPLWVHKLRDHAMRDAESFVAFVKQYGDPKKGSVFYSSGAGERFTVTMFFDAMNREESVELTFSRSLELQTFLGKGPGAIMNQKQFLKTLETFPECIESVTAIRAMVERLQMSKEIKFESNLDPDNLTFIYSEKGGQQEGKLPKKIMLTLPFFEGSENRIRIEVDLDVEMPKSEGDKPSFKLENVKHARTERDAVKAEIDSMKQKLSGWLFLNGDY